MFTLHIDSGTEMRGGQWQALYLIRGLTAAGHRTRLLAPAGSPLLNAAAAQQVDVQPLGIGRLLRAAAGVDLVHAHDARAHTMALIASKPLVVSRRVAFPVRHNVASWWKYRRPIHYLAVSQCVKRILMEAGVEPGKITVVYDGVPVDSWPKTGDRSRVLAVDLEDPGKGKKLIEEAAALADIPVHFSDNLIRDLPEAAVFVYITDLEGLGSAVLLAMAAGAPVLASCVGGLPEIVDDGATGLLTSNEPPAIAKQIQRLLADRPLALRLAARARSRVEKEFSLERMVNETLRAYERILA
ncbi:MAG TPA: glycosyltransferase family 4 protein [Bryobacteraceae bacterium]|nr:glycosyltransferase family 4 protein [Bryobacteraceae bacterium]